MIRWLYLLMILATSPAFAQQHRIPDLSLSPEESARQPSSSAPITPQSPYGNTSGFQRNSNQDLYPGQNMYPNNLPPSGYPNVSSLPNAPSSQFMTGYCDPNFRPAMASNINLAGLQECLQQQKQQVCQQFQALPADVKMVVDEAINCMSSYANGEATGNEQIDPSGCARSDANRIDALKKHWKDQYSAYALVFMPDDVLDNMDRCKRKRY